MLESDTKNHRTRIVVMPQIVFDDLGELFTEQALENNGADRNGFPEEYHLHPGQCARSFVCPTHPQ